jgi:hypothetical protein
MPVGRTRRRSYTHSPARGVPVGQEGGAEVSIISPVQLQSPYPGTPDGALPEPYQHCLDPLVVYVSRAGNSD